MNVWYVGAEELKDLSWELQGVLSDTENGQDFDDASQATLKSVIASLKWYSTIIDMQNKCQNSLLNDKQAVIDTLMAMISHRGNDE